MNKKYSIFTHFLGGIYFCLFCIFSPLFDPNMKHIWYKCMFASILDIYLIKYMSCSENVLSGKILLCTVSLLRKP